MTSPRACPNICRVWTTPLVPASRRPLAATAPRGSPNAGGPPRLADGGSRRLIVTAGTLVRPSGTPTRSRSQAPVEDARRYPRRIVESSTSSVSSGVGRNDPVDPLLQPPARVLSNRCGSGRYPEASHRDRHSYQSAESGAHFGDKLARSLVGGEMATPRRRAVVPQVGIPRPRPALGQGGVVPGKTRVRARRGHLVEASHSRRERMPVQAGRRGRRCVQPVRHHVVEQLVLAERPLQVVAAVRPP